MSSTIEGFGKWRQRLWPVHSYELKKIIPLLLLKFFISMNFTFLQGLKDTLIVTGKNSGAEVIPILKGWIVLPIAILVAMLYSKLSNIFKPSTLFYCSISGVLAAVALYAFVLYPNSEALSPHASADFLVQKFGTQYSHWIAIYRNWVHTLFYITAELWSTIVIFVLYWGFANQITRVNEAKRTYTLFIAAGDIGSMLPGPIVYYYCKKFAGFEFTLTLQVLTGYIIAFGLCILFLYYWMNKHVLSNPKLVDPEQLERGLKTKTKLSLVQSIRYIFRSKYLLSIAMLVMGCALSINLVEVTWKANLRELHPSSTEYYAFLSNTTTCIGFFALITVVFLGGNSLRKLGWYFNAQISPVLIGISGLLFFLLALYRDALAPFCRFIGTTPLTLVVVFGAFQFILAKVVKYSFFDSTKEMVFIPLDQEAKTKGKAAIDVVGSRLGKSGSSWLQVALMEIVGSASILSITPYLIPLVALTIIGWCYSVNFLDKEFNKEQAAQTATA